MTTSTMIALGVVGGLLVLQFLLWTVALYFGAKWAKAETVTWRRTLATTALVFLLQAALGGASLMLVGREGPILIVTLMFTAASLLVPFYVISMMFRLSLFRAVQAWLPTLAAPVAMYALVLLVVRPHVMEVFVSPTNAMCPTIRGNCVLGNCPSCGGVSLGSASAHYRPGEPAPMICEDCFQVTTATPPTDEAQPPDRFLALKCFKPERWDMIVFRCPERPDELYCMRLVGLPGETITIRDGAVYADGKKLVLPEELEGLQYESEVFGGYPRLAGSESNPAQLGEGEYFVLGDFSARSADSRYWQRGAPGHPPYALPESHIEGVVTHIYWPPSRMRAFR